MNDYQHLIAQKQNQRYKLLLALFKAVDGKESNYVDFMEIATKNGFNEAEASEIYNYFTSDAKKVFLLIEWFLGV